MKRLLLPALAVAALAGGAALAPVVAQTYRYDPSNTSNRSYGASGSTSSQPGYDGQQRYGQQDSYGQNSSGRSNSYGQSGSSQDRYTYGQRTWGQDDSSRDSRGYGQTNRYSGSNPYDRNGRSNYGRNDDDRYDRSGQNYRYEGNNNGYSNSTTATQAV
jgi:hypothetical protein